MAKKKKTKSNWMHDENEYQVEDVIFEVMKLEDLKKSLRFNKDGAKVDIKSIKESNDYKKQHKVAVAAVEKYNNTHYKGAINLSACRQILQMRAMDAKIELANRKDQEV